ncbi:MAG: N-acetylglucosamine-6-phosphate deacetylase [Clostridia bacterium]|jgi:N-acetylglucosamine-6-phosphate deacetylase
MNLSGIDVFTGHAVELGVDGGSITSVHGIDQREAGAFEAGAEEGLPYISPGFLDIQVNGYNGCDYSLENLNKAQVASIVASMAKAGVTQHVPTFITMPRERLLRNLTLVASCARDSEELGSAMAGFHVEGPFISPEDGPRGAHDRSYVRLPDFDEFLAWQDAADGRIAYLTVAPEVDGVLGFIHKVVKTGVKVSLGHTRASPEVIRQAVDAGATLSTHLGNGSDTMVPRLRNFLWEQLAADEMFASCICDGFHLPPAVVKVVARAKSLEKLILVSDAALLGGYKPGLYKWDKVDVEVFPDGHIGLPGTTMLAGAAHLLDWDILRFMEFTGYSLGEAVSLCTVNPARFLGYLPRRYGTLSVGAPANLCVFRYDKRDTRLKVLQTYVRGRLVYGAS